NLSKACLTDCWTQEVYCTYLGANTDFRQEITDKIGEHALNHLLPDDNVEQEDSRLDKDMADSQHDDSGVSLCDVVWKTLQIDIKGPTDEFSVSELEEVPEGC